MQPPDEFCGDIMVDANGWTHYCAGGHDGDDLHSDGAGSSWGAHPNITDDERDTIFAQVGLRSTDHRRYLTHHPNYYTEVQP